MNKILFKPVHTSTGVKVIISRMMTAYDVTSTRTLAQVSGHKADTIRSWSREPCTMPYAAIDACSRTTGRSMDWLLFGKQESFSQTVNQEGVLQALVCQALLGAVEYSQIAQVSVNGLDNLARKLTNDVLTLLKQDQPAEPAVKLKLLG
jgi:hypothetical protein